MIGVSQEWPDHGRIHGCMEVSVPRAAGHLGSGGIQRSGGRCSGSPTVVPSGGRLGLAGALSPASPFRTGGPQSVLWSHTLGDNWVKLISSLKNFSEPSLYIEGWRS